MRTIFFLLLVVTISNGINGQVEKHLLDTASSKNDVSLLRKEFSRLGFPKIFSEEKNCRINFIIEKSDRGLSIKRLFYINDNNTLDPNLLAWNSYCEKLKLSLQDYDFKDVVLYVTYFRIDLKHFDEESNIPITWNLELRKDEYIDVNSTTSRVLVMRPVYFFENGSRVE